jgi:hypothetical protein
MRVVEDGGETYRGLGHPNSPLRIWHDIDIDAVAALVVGSSDPPRRWRRICRLLSSRSWSWSWSSLVVVVVVMVVVVVVTPPLTADLGLAFVSVRATEGDGSTYLGLCVHRGRPAQCCY